ncbi:hypothetical protein [Endothiovibrio diazotrophicus]
MTTPHTLLWVYELGGYPNFTPLFQRAGYQVTRVDSGRKAAGAIKRAPPTVIVAEFIVDPNFRDRTGNLETILAAVQRSGATTKVIAFYEPAEATELEKLRARFPDFTALPYPIDEARLAAEL